MYQKPTRTHWCIQMRRFKLNFVYELHAPMCKTSAYAKLKKVDFLCWAPKKSGRVRYHFKWF